MQRFLASSERRIGSRLSVESWVFVSLPLLSIPQQNLLRYRDRFIDITKIKGTQRPHCGNIDRCLVAGIVNKPVVVGTIIPVRPPRQIVGPLWHRCEAEGAVVVDRLGKSSRKCLVELVVRYATFEVFR